MGRLLSSLLILLLLVLLAAGGVVVWGYAQFTRPGPLQTETALVIPRGSGVEGIARRLEQAGILRYPELFMAAVKIEGAAGALKAGEYAFAPGVSMRQVMEDLVGGKAVYHTVTVPEGWSSAQVVARVREHPVLTGPLDEIPAEGSLLPETYTFTRGTTRAQIIQQMKDAQAKALADIWDRRTEGLPVETPEELVVLASIVEKETARADERPRVAGVFVNRLRQRMRLQSDPTILYGIYGGEAWLQDRSAITRSQLDTRTPYNTYQIDRLPPGPIGNPGRAAMEAVANPSRTKDLYFVADGTGGHVFAETYEQHQRNVARWRQVERERREREAQDQPASSGSGG